MYSDTFLRWGKSCPQQTHPTEQLSLWSVIPDTDRCSNKWACIIISCSIKTLSSHCKTSYFHSKTEGSSFGLLWNGFHQAGPPLGIGWWSKPSLMYLSQGIYSGHILPNSPARHSSLPPTDTLTPGLASMPHAWAHLLATHTAMQTFQQLGRL